MPSCYMSNPDQPHKLVMRSNNPPISFCFSCKGQNLDTYDRYLDYHYFCPSCDLEFHWDCVKLKPEISHPFHLSHPLTLTFLYGNHSTYLEFSKGYKTMVSGSYRKCKCCGKGLENKHYHCSICDFTLNSSCAQNPPILTITHEKSHVHTLTLFPTTREISFPCDACGLPSQHHKDRLYTCLPCNYTVHSTCIYLPRVFKITLHPHRLSLTSSLPSGEFFCGVCRQVVDVNHGQYSCNKGCPYAIHSRCATRTDVWDGIDLEGVPEEESEDGDLETFVKIDEDTIKHFIHDHYLKLHSNHGENKFCQACALPISTSDSFYNCILSTCDFIFHETCAFLPRLKPHPLHIHPLTLTTFPSQAYKGLCEGKNALSAKGMFLCNGCDQRGYGFVYECRKETCDFKLDVRCASLPDPVTHDCHDHPLFFNLTKGDQCMGCKYTICSNSFLECIKCKSFLGLKCATLPRVVHYKYDTHPLTLCYGIEEDTTSGQYLCELCESKLDPKAWFYTCDSCSVTLHVKCLLREQVYIKHNDIITIRGQCVETCSNYGNTRPLCHGCASRCVENLVLRRKDRYYCNFSCLETGQEMEKIREMVERERSGSGMRCLTPEINRLGHYTNSSSSKETNRGWSNVMNPRRSTRPRIEKHAFF